MEPLRMGVNLDLFGHSPLPESEAGSEALADGAVILRGFAAPAASRLLACVGELEERAPLRHMQVPGGATMSVAMTSCGEAGWVSDRRGYRYDRNDPASGRPWPAMPEEFSELAARAAEAAGFAGFVPDSCLINSYAPGARLSLHQDSNERDFAAPIVSVSLGLPAVFLFGGAQRSVRPRRILLESGDVVVWGGPARLTFHGVAKLADGEHPLTGARRINLTFRKAL
jgi:alkylated DNA repair protein (DNA oxidative demethylase)